jgi:protein arginine kinase
MLHLPALRLRGEIDNVKRAAKDMTLALRGYHGEGSEASGDFYQLSNQTTLGRTEEDILSEFVDKIIPAVVEYEHQAREALLRKRRAYLEDQVWRAYGVLGNARLLETDETLKLLSMVRLGCCMNLLPNVSTYDVNSLLLQTQPRPICSASSAASSTRPPVAALARTSSATASPAGEPAQHPTNLNWGRYPLLRAMVAASR